MSNKILIISNVNELVRVKPERVIYVESGGNYSTMVLHDKTEQTFTMNLAHIQQLIEKQLGKEAMTFIRLGKQLIVNREAEKSRDNENASSIFSNKEWERYYEKKKNPQRQEELKQKGRQKKSNAYSSKGLFMLLGALVSFVLVIIIAVYHIEIPHILLILLLVSPGILLVAGLNNLKNEYNTKQ